MRTIFVIISLLSAAFFTACADDAPAADTAPAVDSTSFIRKQIDADRKELMLDTFIKARFDNDQFSGSVLIAQRGIILYKKNIGWEDKLHHRKLSDSSAIQLASVSKQFTAAAIMLLQQRGVLRYHDAVKKYLPSFPYDGVTVHHLLTHRGGLDRYTNVCDNYYRQVGEEPERFSTDSALEILQLKCPRPARQPDTKFEYSNTGYAYLAKIVETVTDTAFAEFMRINFFLPLDMHHTYVGTDGKQHQHQAKGYYKNWNGWQDNFLDSVNGDKGVYSTVDDMFKWDHALRNGTILSKKTLEQAYTPFSPDLQGKRYWNYGYGWRIINFNNGKKAVFHNGWWHGFTSAFYRDLSDDITIIILCNKYNKGIYNTRAIVKLLGGTVVDLPEEAEEGGEDITPATRKKK
jgi:CubicO group peptidase (beta-lactamase class C family)